MRKIIYMVALGLVSLNCVNQSDKQYSPEETRGDNSLDASIDGASTDASLRDASIKDASQIKDSSVVDSYVPHCGDSNQPKCYVGEKCRNSDDCITNACNYKGVCVEAPSCVNHFGGDTCGAKEVEDATAQHESCCRSLLVPGFTDSNHKGKQVYLDKYEITAGRMRAFVEAMTLLNGKPDIKGWIQTHRPTIWNTDWEKFLPSDYEGGTITINRLLLGDPRHDGETNPGPGVIVPPPTDQTVNLGLNYQFGAQVYADLHGNNCGVFPGAYGFPTYYYPANVLVKTGEIPRTDALGFNGQTIPAQEFLDTKSLNCATNVILAAFCVWDGGELASAEVLDYVANSIGASDPVSGCGSQYDSHGELLGNIFTHTVQTGGRCPDVLKINATFDAGDVLPVLGSSLNKHVYHYPDLSNSNSDKSWQVAAPGRIEDDSVRMQPNDEPWMDLAGNLNEAVINHKTTLFGIRHRGIGYGSSRSDLNVTLMNGETILRVQRPEAKSALVGGRCIRLK